MNRLSREEVEAIVRLVSQRRAVAYGSGQTVDSLAHALNLSPAQVEDHLRDIRNGGAFTDHAEFRRALIGAGIAAGVLLVLMVGNLVFASSKRSADSGSPVATTPIAELAPASSMAAPPRPTFDSRGARTVAESPIVPLASGPSVQRVDPPPAYKVESEGGRIRLIGEAGDKAMQDIATTRLAESAKLSER